MSVTIPMTAEEKAEAAEMLAKGGSRAAVCAWIGCTEMQLAREIPPERAHARRHGYGVKMLRYLQSLEAGPLESAKLAERMDEIPGYVSRDMSKMRDMGLVANLTQGQARAVYSLTDAGRDALATRTAA